MKNKITDKRDEENLKKKPEQFFSCCGEQMEPKKFHKHLLEKHGIDVKAKPHGTKKMLMHMDGTYWFSSSYEWHVKSEAGEWVKFGEYIRMARRADDMMRFG